MCTYNRPSLPSRPHCTVPKFPVTLNIAPASPSPCARNCRLPQWANCHTESAQIRPTSTMALCHSTAVPGVSRVLTTTQQPRAAVCEPEVRASLVHRLASSAPSDSRLLLVFCVPLRQSLDHVRLAQGADPVAVMLTEHKTSTAPTSIPMYYTRSKVHVPCFVS